MNWKEKLLAQVEKTRQASRTLANLTESRKNEFLSELAENILRRSERIIRANSTDVARAQAAQCSPAFIDRLSLSGPRIEKIARSVADVRTLPDPVGKKLWETTRPNGLKIERVRVPIGVIGIIYESRPDVTIEAGVLCLKSGNCVILRGGKESIRSNAALVEVVKETLTATGIPEDAVNLISSGGRPAVNFLLTLTQYIDVIIPRGGESLIRAVTRRSRIPVIKHYKGVCHTYVAAGADCEMAWKVTFNAKVQRPGTCNATETLLVHRDIAQRFLPTMAEMFRKAGVEMRGCERTLSILPGIKRADPEDWGTEYLDLIIAIRIVDDTNAAVAHIARYGTGHSDAIITGSSEEAQAFLSSVDSACVYHNASTRFTDGGEFGFGAEIGISTDKIHARGPMGLEELTTYKYLIHGNGQLRS